MYELISDSGMKRIAWEVKIISPEWSPFAAPVTMFVHSDDADWYCLKLTKAFPGMEIHLEALARVKAVYVNGIRTQLNNYRDFYLMSDEEYQKTLIKDSRTAEWI